MGLRFGPHTLLGLFSSDLPSGISHLHVPSLKPFFITLHSLSQRTSSLPHGTRNDPRSTISIPRRRSYQPGIDRSWAFCHSDRLKSAAKSLTTSDRAGLKVEFRVCQTPAILRQGQPPSPISRSSDDAAFSYKEAGKEPGEKRLASLVCCGWLRQVYWRI